MRNNVSEARRHLEPQSAASSVGRGMEVEFQAKTSFPTVLEGGTPGRPDLIFRCGANERATAIGDAKYKDLLELARQNEVQLDNPSAYSAKIKPADWYQLYVYLRLSKARKGFFVVPFWSGNEDSAKLVDAPQFTRSPLNGNVQAQVKVLGLNLLCPIGVIRREGARLLADWLRQK